MTRNILQDIVPPDKRSIRNIPVPSRRGKLGGERVAPAKEPTPPPTTEESNFNHNDGGNFEPPKAYPYKSEYNNGGGRFSRKAIWGASTAAVLIVLFALSTLFSGTKVLVTPKTETISLEGTTLEAYQGQTGSGVPYEIITVSKDLGKVVTANGEEQVERRASGQIIVYNNFDEDSQRLIKNTRFETPEGLVYRINDSIVVPGKTTKDGQSVPGSIEVTVYADEAGEKYNVGLKDFTLPGLESDKARFDTIYARSKTEMTGGFIGTVKKVADGDLATAKEELHSKITTDLTSEVVAQVPSDFVIFPDGMFIDFESLPQSDASGNSVTINERGVLRGVMFNRANLSQYVAEMSGLGEIGQVNIANTTDLDFVMENKTAFSPQTDTEFNFAIDGQITLVRQFDSEILKEDLAGRSKKELQSILENNYPAIETAKATVKPFWKRSFPDNPSDITIEIALP